MQRAGEPAGAGSAPMRDSRVCVEGTAAWRRPRAGKGRMLRGRALLYECVRVCGCWCGCGCVRVGVGVGVGVRVRVRVGVGAGVCHECVRRPIAFTCPSATRLPQIVAVSQGSTAGCVQRACCCECGSGQSACMLCNPSVLWGCACRCGLCGAAVLSAACMRTQPGAMLSVYMRAVVIRGGGGAAISCICMPCCRPCL
jgi:hypothetical protein